MNNDQKQSDADLYGNNCLRYTHLDGYPYPRTSGSCKGCKYSFDPNLYDAGCKHPDGLLEREKPRPKRRPYKLSADQEKHANDVMQRVNDAHRAGHPPDAEFR